MSYEDKIESARQFLIGYFERIKEINPVKSSAEVQAKEFFDKLQIVGVSTDEGLKKLSWEEVVTYLPVIQGILPTMVAKELCLIFRTGMEKSTDENPFKKTLSSARVQQLSPSELIEVYNESYELGWIKAQINLSMAVA